MSATDLSTTATDQGPAGVEPLRRPGEEAPPERGFDDGRPMAEDQRGRAALLQLGMRVEDSPAASGEVLQPVKRLLVSRGELPTVPRGSLVTSQRDGSSYLAGPGGLEQIFNPAAVMANPYLNVPSLPRFEAPQDLIDQLLTTTTQNGRSGPLASRDGATVGFDSGDVFLGAGHFMHTWGTLSDSGQIAASTQTRTVTWFGGYHGGVHLIAADENDAPVWMSQQHRFGVDGTWIGQSDRTDAWWEDMPQPDVARVRSIYMFHAWAPDGFLAILQEWSAALRAVGDLIGQIADVAKVVIQRIQKPPWNPAF
jgi:hypothetical protein